MKITPIGNARIIMSNPFSKHNYFGWPSAARLQNGTIAVVASGLRLRHICPFGKTVISYSEDEGESESETNKPVDTKIVFAMPVATSNIIKNYTSSTIVYNQTLGVYTGHMGIDFGAEAGSEVVAVYTGKIDSITTSYLKGTTITIDHGNGLKSVYNSLDASENLVEGQVVNQGQVIGWVSDNNRQEYKDGPHLHFEVLFDGNRIDPNEYLLIAEK